MFNYNLDFAVDCVKSFVDNNQCTTCEKLYGPCVRFICGHSLCEDCAKKIGECLFCDSSPVSYLVDNPQTTRINNAALLLAVFQDTFKINVQRRQRLSEYLKVEKRVFPECIQAPHKYINKRKSFNNSFENKENIFEKNIPGEEIQDSYAVIMNKSHQYVQNWLNQQETMPQKGSRRPFVDLDINTQSFVHKSKQDVVKFKNAPAQEKKLTYKKSLLSKSAHKTTMLNNKVTNSLKIKNQDRQLKMRKETGYAKSRIPLKCDKYDSGIVLDDESVIIQEIGTNTIDKDQQAWLAVLKDAKKDNLEDERNKLNNIHFGLDKEIEPILTDNVIIDTNRFANNVSFYKKSFLFETCKLCNNYLKNRTNTNFEVNKKKDISIVINSSEFVTTINLTHVEENKKSGLNTNSVAIQTDKAITLNESITFDRNATIQKRKNMIMNDIVPTKKLKPNNSFQHADVFGTYKDTKHNTCDDSFKPIKGVVIEDSDTDSSVNCNNSQEVVVEIHKTNDPESIEGGVLQTISRKEYQRKTKRQVRCHTPNSSNSSDKENFDPNRKKTVKPGKKRKCKK